MFQGVDKEKLQWVHIYCKKVTLTIPKADSPFLLSGTLKESSRNQVCPKVIWSGPVLQGKINCFCEVHQKNGPTLKTMFETVKGPLKEKELLHLLL